MSLTKRLTTIATNLYQTPIYISKEIFTMLLIAYKSIQVSKSKTEELVLIA